MSHKIKDWRGSRIDTALNNEKFLTTARTIIEEVKNSIIAFINKFKEIFKKVWGTVKNFIIDNKEMIEKIYYMIKKKKKYQKRIKNRQLLYLKRKLLGRKL